MSIPRIKISAILVICIVSFSTHGKAETPTSETKTSYSNYNYKNNPHRQYSASSYTNYAQNPDTSATTDFGSTSNGIPSASPMLYNYQVHSMKHPVGNGYAVSRQDFDDDDGGIGGEFGLIGLVGLAGLVAFLSPIIGPLLPLLVLPLLPALLPALGPLLLPLLLLPLLLILPLLILFIPIPVITLPGGGRSVSETARMALESTLSEECVERITCEISKATQQYGLDPPWLNNLIEKSKTKSKWIERISRGFNPAATCKNYKCDFLNSWKKTSSAKAN